MGRLLFSPIGLIVISVVFMITSISEIRTDRAFASRGKPAMVEPILKYKEIVNSKKGRPVNREEKADISFTTQDGRSVTLVDRYLPPDVLRQFQNGEGVSIIYLPEDPKSTRFPSEKIPTGMSGVYIPGIFLVLGIIWFLVRRSSQGK